MAGRTTPKTRSPRPASKTTSRSTRRNTTGLAATVVVILAILFLRSQGYDLGGPDGSTNEPPLAPASDVVDSNGDGDDAAPIAMTSEAPADDPAPDGASSSSRESGEAGEIDDADDAGDTNQTDEADLLARINALRTADGLPALEPHPALTAAARDHSRDMADHGLCQHEGSDGSDVDDRMRQTGYAPAAYAENIACGARTPAQAMGQWLASKPHRANLMDERFTDAGIGIGGSGSSSVWTLTLGRQ